MVSCHEIYCFPASARYLTKSRLVGVYTLKDAGVDRAINKVGNPPFRLLAVEIK
jgi:hypothetical protein